MHNPIFSMFAKSPFSPLQEHMGKVYECTRSLEDFFAAMKEDDWEKAAKIHTEINSLEESADDLKRQIRLNLPDGLFMPVPRTDILDLLSKQDRVANRVKDISGLILGRRMTIPTQLQSCMDKFVHCSILAGKKAYQVIQELDELVETGFRGHEVKRVEELIFSLDDTEHDADDREREVRAELFAIESEINPVEVMFLYKIIDWIGDIADRAQEVGHRLHLMLAH